MKRLFFLLALLLNLEPCFQDGKLTLNSGSLMAQSMGDESTCHLICSATVTISAPCSMVTSIPCPGVTITSPPYTPPPPSEPPPPYIPPVPNPCEGPTADPCACFSSCGVGTGPSTPTNPGTPTTPPATKPKEPPRVNCDTSKTATDMSKATTLVRENTAWAHAISVMRTMLGTPGFNDIETAVALDGFDAPDAPVTYQFTEQFPTKGGATSVTLLTNDCTMSSYDFTEATIHSHPEGKAGTINFTPPSGADVYGLVEGNARCPKLIQSYTVAYNGDEYVLYAADQKKMTAFSKANPKANTIDPATNGWSTSTPIGTDFDRTRKDFEKQGYSVHDSYGMAMGQILTKYNTGVTLLKRDAYGKYKQVYVKATTSGGKTTYTVMICQ